MRALLLLVVTAIAVSCSEPAPAPVAPVPVPVASLDDLPRGAAPRIGYVDHQAYVAPDGRRTSLPRRLGVSGIVPYDGGFLVSDNRFFEGTVGLWFVTEEEAHDLPGCSSGPPRRADGWVWWVIAHCPESLDVVRAEIHRARPDGSGERVRILRAAPDENLLLTTAAALDRVAPLRRWVREDAGHQLAVAHRGGWTAVVRRGPDGRRELATEPVRDDPRLPPYVLSPGATPPGARSCRSRSGSGCRTPSGRPSPTTSGRRGRPPRVG